MRATRHLSPDTLTGDDVQMLLRASSGRPRDHAIFSLALGTGLRLGELVGLNVGDVFFPSGEPRSRIRVRAKIAKRGRVGDAFLPAALGPKLVRFYREKLDRHERIDPDAPLFAGLSRRRISPRRVQVLFAEYQRAAGFDRHYPFHALRHTAVTNVYLASRDAFLAQRSARHCSPLARVRPGRPESALGQHPT
ncbi:MAG: tyrosine-type recombinase/integrase [Candidatus Eisenbacteria bacterium]|nr:tyrosine-type recombinase/integrase [Candidatus Eisenbacteria bacterium]